MNTTALIPGKGITTTNDLIQVSKLKATQVLCTFQTSTPDVGIAAPAGTLGEILGLHL